MSRFRSAEVLTLDASLEADASVRLVPWVNSTPAADAIDNLVPGTAWRTIGMPDGGWLMVHQAASDRALSTASLSLYYGGSHCQAVVQSGITRYTPDGTLTTSGPLSNVLLPVDLAVSLDGEWVAVAIAGGCDGCGNPDAALVSIHDFDNEPDLPCREPIPVMLPDDDARVVAVAFDPSGRLLLQTREPSRLYRVDFHDVSDVVSVDLSEVTRYDTGHALFHENPGSGITCASCHPEGGDDGHVWRFEELGLRHTPPLDIGLDGTAPFHWSGELADFDALVEDVFVGRMGADPPSSAGRGALEAWLYTLALRSAPWIRRPSTGRRCSPRSSATVAIPARRSRTIVRWTWASRRRFRFRRCGAPPSIRRMVDRTRPGATVAADDLADLVAFLESM